MSVSRATKLDALTLRYGQSPIDKILRNIFGEKDLGRWSPQGYLLYLRQELFQLLLTEVEERRKQADFSRADMISDLIFAEDETGQPLSNQEVRDLLLSPIFAGGDASGTALSNRIYFP